MKFKIWLKEAIDREKQLEKSALVKLKPNTRATELSRYLYLKKK